LGVRAVGAGFTAVPITIGGMFKHPGYLFEQLLKIIRIQLVEEKCESENQLD